MTETKKASDLLESELATELRQRHRDYYVALAERAEIELRGPNQAAWYELLDSEYDNIRIATEWSLQEGASEESLRLALAISKVWYMRGDSGPSAEWLEKALALDGKATGLRAKALATLSIISRETSFRWAKVDPFLLAQKAVEVARESQDKSALLEALWNLTKYVHIRALGGLEVYEPLVEEGLKIAREIGDEHALADWLWRRANLASLKEGRDAALKLENEALNLFRKLGDKENVAWLLYGLGWNIDPSVGIPLAEEALAIGRELKNDVLILCVLELIGFQKCNGQGDYVGAVKVFEEAVAEFRRPGRKWPVPWHVEWMLADLTAVELEMGDFESARKHNDEARKIDDEKMHDNVNGILVSTPVNYLLLTHEGKLAEVAGDLVTAKSIYEKKIALSREFRDTRSLRKGLEDLGEAELRSGDYDAARRAAEEALSLAVGRDVKPPLTLLGRIAMEEGDLEQARSFFERVLETIRTRYSWSYEEPVVQLHLGRVALVAGEFETASALYGAALTKFAEIGHKPYVAWALEELGALAAARQQFERGAQFYGAAESIREEAHAKVPLNQRRTYEQGLNSIKESLSDDELAQAWDHGRRMTLDAAIQLAVEGRLT